MATTKRTKASKAPARKTSTTRKKASKPKATANGKLTKSKSSAAKPAAAKKKASKPVTSKKKVSTARAAAKSKPAPKKKATTAKKAPAPAKPRKVKTHLTARELRHYRELLLMKRAQLVGDMSTMSEEALRNNDSANLSHMPLHMADVGSDSYEQELTLNLVESDQKTVRQIDEALKRIADGTYGICAETGRPITKARLDAKPWAKYCIEVAREIERNGGRV